MSSGSIFDASLARIEFFVLIMGFSSFLVFVLDAYRYRTRSSAIKIPLLVLETITDSLLEYTIGLIHIAPFSNELFALWAVLLNTSQSDTDYITAYGIPETYARRRTELKVLILSFLLANLNATLGDNFKGLLWVLWSVRPLQVLTRIYYYDVALNSYSQGRNSEFVAEYSKNECSRIREVEPNPTTMQGYEYIVWGENAQKIESNAPARQFNIDVYIPTRCVTVEKIWQCRGRLLSSWDRQNKIKDVCLSYALYKILRCETESIILTEECFHKMQNLIFRGILSEDDADERLFRIFETEVAFLNDYKRTRYPIIIWYGFPVINFVTFFVTVIVSLILAINLHKREFDYSNEDTRTNIIAGHNVDRFITYIILFLFVLKEIWQIVLYIFSDWTKIRVVCKYYLQGHWLWRSRLFEHIAWRLCTIILVRRWCKRMPQYNILQSFNYNPYFKNIFYYVSMHVIRRPMKGAKLRRDIKIYKEVKKSIVDALRSINITGESMEYMRPVYRDVAVADEFKWACSQETCSHLILIWHIATSMSEIELFMSRPEQTGNFVLAFPLSCIKNLFSRKPFLVDLNNLEGNLRSDYISANAMSRYCAYLLNFAPELLPENKLFPRVIFENTVQKAREALTSCDSLESIYRRLMEIGESLEEEQGQEEREVTNVSIVEMGARLGYALITKMESENRWKMLSQYWANLLLYLAPTRVTEYHEQHLRNGGEFITLLWALFSHSGIFQQVEEEQAAANEEEAQGTINVNGTVQSEEQENRRPGDASIADQNLEEEQESADTRNSDQNEEEQQEEISEL